jgi:hypothetical protein
MQGNVKYEGHEKCAGEHPQQCGQRMGLLPELHTAAESS